MVDWIGVAEAAEELGVSPRQVRKLIDSGGLPARRLRSGWLVPEAAIRARRQHGPSAGRPLSASMAWAVLSAAQCVLSAGEAPAQDCLEELLEAIEDRRVRHRLRHHLAHAPAPPHWEHWLARRAERRQVWVHPGVLERLAADRRLRPGGGFAAAVQGAGLAASPPRRFYVDADIAERVIADYHAQDDPEGPLEMMVIPADVPALLRSPAGEPVPIAVALADMLESSDARERHLAQERLAAVVSGVCA